MPKYFEAVPPVVGAKLYIESGYSDTITPAEITKVYKDGGVEISVSYGPVGESSKRRFNKYGKPSGARANAWRRPTLRYYSEEEIAEREVRRQERVDRATLLGVLENFNFAQFDNATMKEIITFIESKQKSSVG